MDTKYEEKPPNYSSVVFEGQSLSPSAPPTDSGPVRIDMPVVPTFFEQAMLSVPSAINITHGESLYANDTDYFIRDANGSLLFSGQVESVDGEKIIPFKNWERRTVFVVKITTPTDLMVVDIYTQNGTTHVGTMTNDFKSEDWPTLTTISTGSSHKTYHPVVVSEEDFGLKDSFGKMAANVHITRNYSPRAQRSGAAEVKDVQISLSMLDPDLNGFDKTAFLGWALFWVVFARLSEKSSQTSTLLCVFGFVAVVILITLLVAFTTKSKR